jgi:hypothetical protein
MGSTDADAAPGGVTFMPKPWRDLDVLAEAEKAVHERQSPST